MKKTLGVMLLATLMAGCANTTSLNKDTTIGDLLGIGPISMPTGYGQAATTKPAQGVTSQSLIRACVDYYVAIQGSYRLEFATKTKEEKVTKLNSGNYRVSVDITIAKPYGDGIWDQIVCEFNQNGEMGGGGGINYNIEGIK